MPAVPDLSSSRATATIRVSARGEHRLRTGAVAVSRGDVSEVSAGGGDVVALVGPRGQSLGYGLFSDRSPVAVRLVSRERAPDDALWRSRLASALAYRRTLDIDATAYRVVHAEGDHLPSLVVDRYGDVLVLQAESQGTDRHLGLLTQLLVDLVDPTGILARHDVSVRGLEGLSRYVEPVFGQVPREVEVRDGSLRLAVDPWRGASTGLYLDLREIRQAATRHARGRGLDGFCHTGGFALHLAGRCRSVLAVDHSASAIDGVTRNAALNGLASVHPVCADVLDVLRELARTDERFDTIVLDPPAFERVRSARPAVVARHKEINQRALGLLSLRGTLVTCCRSPHLRGASFQQLVADAANAARVRLVVVEVPIQSRDHPMLLNAPETTVVTCLIVRRIE